MTGPWHTDRKVGEIAVLPNGTRIRIAALRGRRVRIEFLDPHREPHCAAPEAAASAHLAREA